MTESDAGEISSPPRLTLSEALDRYRINGLIGDAADREVWQDIAAGDVLPDED
jgi:hypothetical protein